jgi:hypothetical protein
VIAFEEDDARPDIDCLFVFGCEVMIKTGDEKFFDARRALGVCCGWRLEIGALWLRHQCDRVLTTPQGLSGKTPDPSMN